MLAFVLSVAVAQVRSGPTAEPLRVAGRLVDTAGAPFPHQNLRIGIRTRSGPSETSYAETDDRGGFAFPAASHTNYDVSIVDVPQVGTMTFSLGRMDIDFGTIALKFPHPGRPQIAVLGPITASVPRFHRAAESTPSQSGAPQSITLVYLTSDCDVNIVQRDGTQIRPEKEKDQSGCAAIRLSTDEIAAGWVVEYNGCCQSYPLPLKLVIFKPGRPLHRFVGDERAIWNWRFVDGSRYVALYQDFPHGKPAPHFELRDIDSERLVAKWEDDVTAKAPNWTKGLVSR